MLKQLRGELRPNPNQYGGVPKCGVEHMLVDLWEKIMATLDGGDKAAVLLGVDYEKTFNRMDHTVCLRQLKKLGASKGSRSLVRAFLEGRRMTIRIDDHRPDPRPITRGSPQGSVLGCLLYCIMTQLLTSDLRKGAGQHRGREPRIAGGYFPQDSSDDEGVEFWRAENATVPGPEAFLYVDDTTLVDEVDMGAAVRHVSTAITKESFESLALGRDFDTLSSRADEIGMKINAKKTQLLVISPANGCLTSGLISPEGSKKIESVDRLKHVGFTFGDAPTAKAQVEAIEDQYKRKKWMLYHLREAGFKDMQLYRLYCCYVRTCIEFCSAVYHALLTKGQSYRLECLQKHALGVCFGYAKPIEDVMEEWAIESLEARRTRRCDAFIAKAWANPRFNQKWFPLREEVGWSLRTRREVQETRAATQRRFNSRLVFTKRRANELGLRRLPNLPQT